MKLIFLGTGSAFTVGDGNYQSNMVLENDQKERLLIDCGSDARHSLFEQGLVYQDINSVYISHLHADHVGGLEWLSLTSHFDESCRKPVLFISSDQVEDLWNKVLQGGLENMQDEKTSLSTFFDVHPVRRDFTWSGITFQLIPTFHIHFGDKQIPSYGLQFEIHGKLIFITTDTQFTPEHFQNIYKRASLIFHDCEIAQDKTGVHAHYDDLKTLDPAIKKKMWLYHYNPGPLPDARADGFAGFVVKGQSFDLNNISRG